MGWGNVKPPSGAQIDRSHPLAGGLVASWLMNNPGGMVIDSASAGKYNLSSPAIPGDNFISWKVGPRGTLLDRNNTISTEALTIANALTTTQTFSIVTRVFPRSIAADGFGALITNTAGNAGFFLVDSPLKVQWLPASKTITTLLANTWYDLAITCNAGNLTYYINGVADITLPAAVASQNLTSIFSDTSSEFLDGQVDYLHVWVGRTLSLGNIQSFRFAPYDLYFKPTSILESYRGSLIISRNQYQFRFRNDDGTEISATWKDVANANVSIGKNVNVRLRIQTDIGGDPPSEAFKIQYRKVGTSTWLDLST